MLVLVTGATGFVGRHLCESLRAIDGIRVRAVVRGGRPVPPALSAAEIVAAGDLAEPTNWERLLEGVDVVVHLAARVHVMAERSEDPEALYQKINVEATTLLAREAKRAGVQRFIFVSSIKVNGERTHGRPFRADDPPGPEDSYARSKRDAEERLRQLASDAFEISIVRPPLVYGPGVSANFERLLRIAASGAPLPLASIRNARSLVSVWTLAHLLATLALAPFPVSGVWLVSDGEDLATGELIRRLRSALGLPPRLFACPVVILRVLGALLGRSAEIERLTESLQIDIEPTRARLQWSPPLSSRAALERTVHARRAQRADATDVS